MERELREQSRRSGNYWLRVAGVVVLLGVTMYLTLGSGVWRGGGVWMVRSTVRGGGMVFVPGPVGMGQASTAIDWIGSVIQSFEGRGGAVFGAMNLVILAAIWLVGPLMTADALSRERREGTLGLLFLTPMRARDIVVAKLVAHGYRSGLVLVGVLPVLMLPVLLGGLTWLDVTRAAILDAGALLLALMAGIWASTRWQGARAVLLGALASAVVSAGVWLAVWGWMKGVLAWARGGEFDAWTAMWQQIAYGWVTMSRVIFEPQWLLGHPAGRPVTHPAQLLWALLVFGVALVIGVWVMRRASLRVAEVQREAIRPGAMAQVEEVLAKPVGQARLLGWFRDLVLRRVPHLWPELRSWRLRVAPWVALLGLALVEVRSASDVGRGLMEWGRYPWVVLAMFGAMLGAAAFYRDRVSGVLELVLTVPSGETMLLLGKFVALIVQVGPALVLVLVFEMALARSQGMDLWVYCCFVVPRMGGPLLVALAAGAFFSLRMRTYVPAFLSALAVAGASSLLVPAVASALAGEGFGWSGPAMINPEARLWSGFLSALIAWGFVRLLFRDLGQRERMAV